MKMDFIFKLERDLGGLFDPRSALNSAWKSPYFKPHENIV